LAKPVLAYKAVSMSPFKVQEKKEFSPTNTSNTNGSTGKVKISDQFLSKINQNKPVETKSASSPVKSNTNKFDNSFSPKNYSENEQTQSTQLQQQTKTEPEQYTAPISPVQPSSYTNGSNGLNGHSNATQKQAIFSPPMYKESDEDDDWGDNANDPIQALPTHSAPLASFNEDYQDDYHSPVHIHEVFSFSNLLRN